MAEAAAGTKPPAIAVGPVPVGRVFLVFLRLGLTSFGGPVAHLGYFRDAFVRRLRWLDEAAFADLVALCQFLPGPASSQVGMGIGYEKAGIGGAVAAFLGFTLPSAVVMAALGIASTRFGLDRGVAAGLAVAALAVVAEAVRAMAVSLAAGRIRAGIALTTTALSLLFPVGLAQILVLAGAGLLALAVLRDDTIPAEAGPVPAASGRRLGAVLLAIFVLLLAMALAAGTDRTVSLAGFLAGLYRSGALVFGGGHVVLPLLNEAVVAPGYVGADRFVFGYGAAQAMPGPLFSIAAFLGAAAALPGPLSGALLATLALFLPAFLLVMGVLPFWRRLRRVGAIRRALSGVNATVVGLLGAALYDPVFVGAVHSARDLAAAVIAYALLTAGRMPAWGVVLLAALGGHLFL